MRNPKVSVIIEAEEESSKLILALIDIDNYLSKLNLSYEVFVLSPREECKEIVAKFLGIVRYAKFKCVSELKEGQIKELVSGDLHIRLRGFSAPDFASMKSLIESVSTNPKREGVQLSFGYYRDSGVGGKLLYLIGRAINMPIRLDCHNIAVAFTKEISSSVLSIQKTAGEARDLELAMLAKRFGFKMNDIEIRARSGEGFTVKYENKLKLLAEYLKIRVMIFANVYSKTGLSEGRVH